MQQQQQSPKFLSTHELAERWSVHPGTLYEWRKAGKGPRWIKPSGGRNGHIRYPIEVILDWEQKQGTAHTE